MEWTYNGYKIYSYLIFTSQAFHLQHFSCLEEVGQVALANIDFSCIYKLDDCCKIWVWYTFHEENWVLAWVSLWNKSNTCSNNISNARPDQNKAINMNSLIELISISAEDCHSFVLLHLPLIWAIKNTFYKLGSEEPITFERQFLWNNDIGEANWGMHIHMLPHLII